MAPPERRAAWIRRWHRRIGVVASLLVILLAFTGFALNHSQELLLDRLVVRSAPVLRWYGIELPERIDGFAVADHWISRQAESLFLDRRQIATCRSELVGAVAFEELLVAACEQELLLFTAEGLLLDRIDALYRLPVPVTALGVADRQLMLRARGQVLRVEPEAPEFHPQPDAAVTWSSPEPLPQPLATALAPYVAGDELTLERLMLDLHSGRLLGIRGVWLMDAAALAMVVLALTGLMAWRRSMR